jgi:hypothetical protein
MKILTSFFVCILITCFYNSAFAKIWRVNNGGASADFTDIPAAITGATAGDTVQVEGSTIGYTYFTCTKKLIFIGPGYLLPNNPKTQFNPNSAKVYGIFAPGSDGSQMMGFQLVSTISLQASNVKISRNFSNGSSIQIGQNLSNTYSNDTIEQNYYIAITVNGTANTITNLQINNNILYYVTLPTTNCTGVFYNNIEYSTLTISNFLCENNIISGDTTSIATTNVFKNNIFYNGSLNTSPNGNGNFYVTPFTSIFVDWTDLFSGATATDGDAMLKSGAWNTGGVGGVAMGVFSGANTYVLSGMPPVPSIYQLTVPNTISTSPMPVTISIKSHN